MYGSSHTTAHEKIHLSALCHDYYLTIAKKKLLKFASCIIKMIDNFNKFGNVRAASDIRACQLIGTLLRAIKPLGYYEKLSVTYYSVIST